MFRILRTDDLRKGYKLKPQIKTKQCNIDLNSTALQLVIVKHAIVRVARCLNS